MATPSTRVRRLLTTCSASIDSSRGERVVESSAITTTGCALSLLKRAIVGGLASGGNCDCTSATLSRSSCIARSRSLSSVNSTPIWPRPSKLREVMRLMPAIELTASSSGLQISRSTASGDAPG